VTVQRTAFDDLADESAELDAIVAELPAGEWAKDTPAAGWTIAHQIAHLAWTDRMTLLSAAGEAEFAPIRAMALQRPTQFVDTAAAEDVSTPPAELLDRWRDGRHAVETALRQVPKGHRLPWFGPPMSALSMATARLMETWAHGQDIRDTLGLPPAATDRLRNVAHLAYRTREFSFQVRGKQPPAADIFLELTAPSGATWQWGDPDCGQRVIGPALDFCLLATQRRHRSDTRVSAAGADADEWLSVVQAFAGPPGAGREPDSRGTGGT
jgi:uncharacterized protein (TIGR03084 family)